MLIESTCLIDGCDKPVKSRGWCQGHYMRWRKYGDPSMGTPALPPLTRVIVIPENGTALVPLWRRGKIVAHALIDAPDVPLVDGFRWRIQSATPLHRYALRQIGSGKSRQTLLMHRVILGLPAGRVPEVDHINHDTLDNRRPNLNACSHSVNMQNRSGSRIEFVAKNRRWRARLQRDGKRIALGHFDSREGAEATVREWMEANPIARSA